MQKLPLSDIGFLATASPALRNMVAELAVGKKLAAGEVLFEQGSDGDAMFAIISGEVEVSVTSAGGRKLGLDIMGPGELLGEIALFSPGPRTATIMATMETEVWRLKNADVSKALRAKPELYVDMIELAGKRMRWLSALYHEQVFMNVTSRLARKILHLSGPRHMKLHMSHADLATFIGATRETVSKTLSVWKQSGLITMGRSTLTVLDADKLEKISQAEFS